ncbi:MAG: LexA family protein [Methylobacter sp.]
MPIALQNSAFVLYLLISDLISMHKLKHSSILKSKHCYLFSCRYPNYNRVMHIDYEEKLRLELGARVDEAISSMPRGTKVNIAKLCNISPTAITGWIKTGRIKKDSLEVVSRVTGYNLSWLITGKGKKKNDVLTDIIAAQFLGDVNVRKFNDKKGLVPLISWVQAGAFCEVQDLHEVGDAIDWLPCPTSHGPRTFSLMVTNDSMVPSIPGHKSYPEGTIIYVDPDRTVTNGCKVVAKILDSNEATFKMYREDAGKKWLVPLNNSYEKIEIVDGMHICGVLVFSGSPE